MPTVAPTERFEVSWLRRLIALADPTAYKIGAAAKFWHSAIIIKHLSSNMVMLFQYEALNFEPSSFYPAVTPEREINWNNSAVVGWLPSMDPKAWQLNIKMGFVTGTVLNKWLDWVSGFAAQHPHYNLWSVWDRVGMFPPMRDKFQFFRDSCCHRFTEDGLSAFHSAGADFSEVRQPLCRNYFVIIQDTLRPITKVDRSDPNQWNRVVDFYGGLQHLVGNKMGNVSDMVKIWIGLVLKYGYTAYLADSDLSNYYLVHLSMPYGVYLLQRMNLPWQTVGDPKECWSQENVSMPQDLPMYAMSSVVV